MADGVSSPTISLRERTRALVGAEDHLPRWVTLSFVLHGVLIGLMLAVSIMPSATPPAPPVYVVDLVGGERVGRSNLGTEIAPVQKQPTQRSDVEERPAPVKSKEKGEVVKEKSERIKISEKKTPAEESIALKERTVKEKTKAEVTKAQKSESSAEPSADSVRERLIQAAAERARTRTESAPKPAKAEPLSAGSGEGDGAAALGAGGRGGPGIVKGLDFIIYQNRITNTIKANWVWVGQRSDLKVVVQFGIKDNGEITGIKIVQASGDATYDESVLRAVKKSSPLPSPPAVYRKDFSEVVYTFRPSDLGA